jgi:hypothetical protein
MSGRGINPMNEQSVSTKLKDLNKTELSGNKAQLFFPGVPVEYVRGRLSQAFAAPITRGPGFPLGRTKYKGQMQGDYFDILYTSYGKSRISFNFYGRLIAEPNGTRIEFACGEIPMTAQLVGGILLGLFMASFALYSFGVRGLILVLGVLLTGTVMGTVFGALFWAAKQWSKIVAESSVRNLLQQIVSQ